MDEKSRAEIRAEDARVREQMADDARRAEARAAQVLIDQFVVDAKAAGIKPERLRAHLFDGGTARTNVTGWYLKRNETVGIGVDGSYYVLTVPGGFKERLTGVHVEPSLPPLIVSKGGRDGESGPLTDYLAWRLARG